MRVTVPVTLSIDVGGPDPDEAARQHRRLFEAAVAAPLMLYAGSKTGGLAGSALFVIGAATFYLSGRDYLRGRSVAAAQMALPAASPVPAIAAPSAATSGW